MNRKSGKGEVGGGGGAAPWFALSRPTYQLILNDAINEMMMTSSKGNSVIMTSSTNKSVISSSPSSRVIDVMMTSSRHSFPTSFRDYELKLTHLPDDLSRRSVRSRDNDTSGISQRRCGPTPPSLSSSPSSSSSCCSSFMTIPTRDQRLWVSDEGEGNGEEEERPLNLVSCSRRLREEGDFWNQSPGGRGWSQGQGRTESMTPRKNEQKRSFEEMDVDVDVAGEEKVGAGMWDVREEGKGSREEGMGVVRDISCRDLKGSTRRSGSELLLKLLNCDDDGNGGTCSEKHLRQQQQQQLRNTTLLAASRDMRRYHDNPNLSSPIKRHPRIQDDGDMMTSHQSTALNPTTSRVITLNYSKKKTSVLRQERPRRDYTKNGKDMSPVTSQDTDDVTCVNVTSTVIGEPSPSQRDISPTSCDDANHKITEYDDIEVMTSRRQVPPTSFSAPTFLLTRPPSSYFTFAPSSFVPMVTGKHWHLPGLLEFTAGSDSVIDGFVTETGKHPPLSSDVLKSEPDAEMNPLHEQTFLNAVARNCLSSSSSSPMTSSQTYNQSCINGCCDNIEHRTCSCSRSLSSVASPSSSSCALISALLGFGTVGPEGHGGDLARNYFGSNPPSMVESARDGKNEEGVVVKKSKRGEMGGGGSEGGATNGEGGSGCGRRAGRVRAGKSYWKPVDKSLVHDIVNQVVAAAACTGNTNDVINVDRVNGYDAINIDNNNVDSLRKNRHEICFPAAFHRSAARLADGSLKEEGRMEGEDMEEEEEEVENTFGGRFKWKRSILRRVRRDAVFLASAGGD